MNMFASLAVPLRHRPGDANGPIARLRRDEPRPGRGKRSDVAHDNPWALTTKQARIMDLLVGLKKMPEICADLCVEAKAIESHTLVVRKKMSVATTLQAALLWDRWRRSQA
jgi:DNA-binding NarL/FixJ family response regulator